MSEYKDDVAAYIALNCDDEQERVWCIDAIAFGVRLGLEAAAAHLRKATDEWESSWAAQEIAQDIVQLDPRAVLGQS